MDIQIRCKYDTMMSIAELKTLFNPKNTNKHPKEQVERLAKIFEYSGVRKAATISNLSGLMTKGHGRVLSAEFAGMTHYPVVYEDYDDTDMEIADINADNAIALWAYLDFSMINDQVGELGPDFDPDMLGIKDFHIDVPKFDLDEDTDKSSSGEKKYILEAQFPNDMEMMDVHDDLLNRGYIVKVK